MQSKCGVAEHAHRQNAPLRSNSTSSNQHIVSTTFLAIYLKIMEYFHQHSHFLRPRPHPITIPLRDNFTVLNFRRRMLFYKLCLWPGYVFAFILNVFIFYCLFVPLSQMLLCWFLHLSKFVSNNSFIYKRGRFHKIQYNRYESILTVEMKSVHRPSLRPAPQTVCCNRARGLSRVRAVILRGRLKVVEWYTTCRAGGVLLQPGAQACSVQRNIHDTDCFFFSSTMYVCM